MADIVLDRLKAQLLTSGLQDRNSALYQVINQLIDFLRTTTQTANDAASAISSGIAGPIGPAGPAGVAGKQGIPGLDGRGTDDEGVDSIPFIGTSLM